MASTADSIRRSPFSADTHASGLHKAIPILSSSPANSSRTPPGGPMELTPSSSASMGPPMLSSPVGDRNGTIAASNSELENTPTTTNGTNAPAIGAAAAAQQPKVVQTAFIHKLYNMLEDQSIQHLISWSNTNESFVMSPSSEFSKVLSSYFKHTNISSFVRQLNMYGFHKVSDVFHTGSPDSPLWEFKHGNGSFKRGDLVGLREIKRRASRHALIHRDSFPTGPKVSAPPPGAPVEPMPDPLESRLAALEHNVYDMHTRLARSEDSYAYVNSKCQMLTESLKSCQQWSLELSNVIMIMVPDPQSQVHKDAAAIQREIHRQAEALQGMETSQDSLHVRPPYYQAENGPPLSPHQAPQDERRGSLAGNGRQGPFRQPVPPHLAITPRRYGSIGTGNYSPSSARPPVQPGPPPPPPPQLQHPLATVSSPPANLSRRHTSADIRLHGWNVQPPAHSPYASGQNSSHWPSSPHRAPLGGGGDQQIRDALASYEISRGPRQQGSRHATPPLSSDPVSSSSNNDSGWTLPGARYPFKNLDTPGPHTRRSSLASNVHSLLNPAETAERDDEDDHAGPEERKRKRLQ